MKRIMKISITVPTYNQGPFIADCLESIRIQTHQDLEVVIQDSLSNDETQKICENYAARDGRFKYYREKDSGQSDAINRGLNRADGALWTWICSDDFYSNSHSIEALVSMLKNVARDPKVIGCFGNAQFVTEKGEIQREYVQIRRDIEKRDFQLDWPLSQPASILYLSGVKKIGGVKEHLHLGMDLDLFLRLLQEDKKLVYVPEMIANVRLQPESKSVKYEKKTAENALMLIKEHFGSTGDLSKSAYHLELQRILEETWSRKLDSGLSRIPVLKSFIRGTQSSLHELTKEDSKLNRPHHILFRNMWRPYQMVKNLVRRCVRKAREIRTKFNLLA
jgi:glycosyltransferase involved in cell wall biosynthesis